MEERVRRVGVTGRGGDAGASRHREGRGCDGVATR